MGKIPWSRKWQATPIFLPGNFHGQRSLVGYSSRGCRESDMTEHVCMHAWSLLPSPSYQGAATSCIPCTCHRATHSTHHPWIHSQFLRWLSGSSPQVSVGGSVTLGPRWWEPACLSWTEQEAPWSPVVPINTAWTSVSASWLCSWESTGNGAREGRRGEGGEERPPESLPDHQLRTHCGNGQQGPRRLILKD